MALHWDMLDAVSEDLIVSLVFCLIQITGIVNSQSEEINLGPFVECMSDLCENGGRCVKDGDTFFCSCIEGFTGEVCETDINECLSDPCVNGGTCIEDIMFYACTCPNGYTGVHCQTEINECMSNPCVNGGTCMDGIGLYRCTCPVIYTGYNCQAVSVRDIEPRVGPMSGGTTIMVTGDSVHQIDQILIGDIVCQVQNMSDPYICMTGKLKNHLLVNQLLSVYLHQTHSNIKVDTGLNFTYVEDPTISTVEPLISILQGGVELTVNGTDLDIVGRPVMVVDVQSLITGKGYMVEVPCVVDSNTRMHCLMPRIDIESINNKRKRRQASPISINVQYQIRIEIGFELDGVDKYKNLTAVGLAQFSNITVFADPVIKLLQPSIVTFTSTWPIYDKEIEIEGERLLDGLRKEDYMVQIGEGYCQLKLVTSNLIVCEPPSSRPHVAKKHYIGPNMIPILVIYATSKDHIGYLSYQQNVFEYPPFLSSFVIALVFVIVPAFIAITCAIYKGRSRKRPLYKYLRQDYEYGPVQLHRDDPLDNYLSVFGNTDDHRSDSTETFHVPRARRAYYNRTRSSVFIPS